MKRKWDMLQVKSKQQIIEAICEHNRTAAREFLINFEERALENYLERLTTLQGHRGRTSIWVRPSDSRAMTA
tara:strand:+ start:2337 stop:2552 length:216 start_codon:yes stop_codon:yes gene_type:complete